MSPAAEQPKPIPVTIVEERRAPAQINGIPTTLDPANNGVQPLLPTATRRRRAVVSVTGNGTVAFGTSASDLENAAASSRNLFLVAAPAVFELESTNPWWIGNVTGTALVSVIGETETDT